MTIGFISSIINILFEVWFIHHNFIKIKQINNKKIKFYFGILISYILSSILIGFTYKSQIFMALLLAVFSYLIAKKLYSKKVQIIDFLLIYYIISFMLFVTIFTTLIFGYNIKMMIINRLMLLIIALTIHKLINKVYIIYKKNWNRGNNHKIKSVTLRSGSIITMNIFIYLINNYILYYLLKIINK